MEKSHPHIGSSFEDFLAGEGILESVTAGALERVAAWQRSQGVAVGQVEPKASPNR